MVTGDMNIMEAVEKYPVIVEVLQRNGLGCVGCMIASGETLAEGIEAHGLDAKAILDERYKEFIGEGKRWWDLLRAGDNFVYDEVASMTSNGTKKNIYLPISPAMIADDNTLVQTPGY